MKLCPQCEFIYEDDQNLCDMDGEALVHDTRLGVFQSAGPAVITSRPTKSRLRIVAIPVVAGLVLSSILFIAYCASAPLLNSNFASPRRKSIAPQTNLQRQGEPLPKNSSLPPPPSPSPTPTTPATDPKSNSTGTDELKDKSVSALAVKQAPKGASLKTTEDRLTIPRELPPLPRVMPLPRLLPAQRLGAKPGAKISDAASSEKQQLAKQQSFATSKRSLIVEVPPSSAGATKTRPGVRGFLKKTARVLRKPFKF